jgi:predicted AAA+ superfamily ATPase
MFYLFQNYLKDNGVEDRQIQNINFEDANYSRLLEWKALHDHIQSNLVPEKKNYIFLDEIQNVPDFQKAVNSLRLKENVDLYLTGSNSRILSGEFATLLSGRYIEIKMLPLSFKEYAPAYPGDESRDVKFSRYLECGSFPYALQLLKDSYTDTQVMKEQIRIFLDGLYSSVVKNDIMQRHTIKDMSRLESVIRFVFDNIGNETSINNISKIMKQEGRVIQTQEVDAYMDALMNSYVIYKANRYDVKGRQLLKTNAKYYVADIGLRYYLLGREGDDGHILENIVYLELVRRGYRVYVGKVGTAEVDFVATKDGMTEYYQVAQTVMEKSTLDRELQSLDAIKDHNQKFLLTMDLMPTASYNGIQRINVLDWLVG